MSMQHAPSMERLAASAWKLCRTFILRSRLCGTWTSGLVCLIFSLKSALWDTWKSMAKIREASMHGLTSGSKRPGSSKTERKQSGMFAQKMKNVDAPGALVSLFSDRGRHFCWFFVQIKGWLLVDVVEVPACWATWKSCPGRFPKAITVGDHFVRGVTKGVPYRSQIYLVYASKPATYKPYTAVV